MTCCIILMTDNHFTEMFGPDADGKNPDATTQSSDDNDGDDDGGYADLTNAAAAAAADG